MTAQPKTTTKRTELDILLEFTNKWELGYDPDYYFITNFLVQNAKLMDRYGFLALATEPQHYTLNQYYIILVDYPKTQPLGFMAELGEIVEINFFLTLSTKFFKTKYTITNHNQYTLVTASVGMILKYYGNFKKFFRRSYRANVLLIKFVKNTIIKLIRKKKYVFILEGLNAKIFNLINTFNFLKKDTNMVYYLVRPKISYGRKIFKKIKPIKRKIQKKNHAAVATFKSNLVRFSKSNFKI